MPVVERRPGYRSVVLAGSSAHLADSLRRHALFRKAEGVDFQRERLATPDGPIFCCSTGARGTQYPRRALVILSHGLGGNSRRPYIIRNGASPCAAARGFDVLAWNFRGCGGELNALSRYYHSLVRPTIYGLSSPAPTAVTSAPLPRVVGFQRWRQRDVALSGRGARAR